MARGIIVAKPNTGMPNGKIALIEGTPSGGGGGAAAGAIEAGTLLNYTETVPSNVGDVVDFVTPDGRIATNIVSGGITGTVITGPSGDVTVNAGESAFITGATVDGKIMVNGGYLTIVGS